MKILLNFLLISIFSFSILSSTFANESKELLNIPKISTTKNIQKENIKKNTSTSDNIVTPSIHTTPKVEPFCNINLKNTPEGAKAEYTYPKVSKKVNKYIILTYINTYGKETFLEEQDRLNRSISKFDLTEGMNGVGAKEWFSYQRIENECLAFRKKHPENNNKIIDLYKQVNFFNQYYSDYPKELLEGITPGFLIFLIGFVDTTSSYLLMVLVGNCIFWITLYMIRPNEEKEYSNKIIMAFWYILIVYSIKVGVLGTLIAFVGFEGLSFVELLFL